MLLLFLIAFESKWLKRKKKSEKMSVCLPFKWVATLEVKEDKGEDKDEDEKENKSLI